MPGLILFLLVGCLHDSTTYHHLQLGGFRRCPPGALVSAAVDFGHDGVTLYCVYEPTEPTREILREWVEPPKEAP